MTDSRYFNQTKDTPDLGRHSPGQARIYGENFPDTDYLATHNTWVKWAKPMTLTQLLK